MYISSIKVLLQLKAIDINLSKLIIIFVLNSVYHIAWVERSPSIFFFSYILADFTFSQITSHYFISSFPWSSPRELPLTLKFLHLLDQFFIHSFHMTQFPVNIPSCSSILVLFKVPLQKSYSQA